jgi:cholesterol transport system auxiliary component
MMTQNRRRQTAYFSASLLAAPMILALSGCVSFGAKAPPTLLVLTAEAKVQNGAAKTGDASEAMVVLIPDIPRKLDTNRVPVQIDDGSIAYLKDAFWADKPSRLMQSLLIETLSAKTGKMILSEVEAGGKAGSVLSGNLTEFGIDASGTQAVVVFDAVRMARGKPLTKQRFEAREALAAIAPGEASFALNRAANKVAGEIADWVAANP